MPGLVVEEKETSLKRLQNLESNFPDFAAQVAELANILGLRLDDALNTVAGREHSRAQWVARWILKKLSPSTPTGVQARVNKSAWILLRKVVEILPTSVAARTLQYGSFMAIVTNTLQENLAPFFSASVSDVEHNAATAVDGQFNYAEVLELSENGSKRKRENMASTQSPAKRLKINGEDEQHEQRSTEERRALCLAVSCFLGDLSIRAQMTSPSQGAKAAELMQATLRVNTQQAADLLGSSLHSINSALDEDLAEGGAAKSKEVLDVYVWLWQIRNAGPPSHTAEAFSKAIMIPAIRLISLLGSTETSHSGEGPSDFIVLSIRRLIAKHLITPVKADYLASRSKTQSKHTDSTSSDGALLYTILEPLRSDQKGPLRVRELKQLTPLLFEIAIACSPLSTPRKRVAELPWLQHLFGELAQNCGYNSSGSQNNLVRARNPQALQAMLRLCKTHGLTFSRQMSRNLLSILSVQTDDAARALDWRSIAAVIRLDPEAVLPDQLDPMLGREDAKDILTILCKRAASDAATPHRSGSNITEGENINQYPTIREGFILPLLRASVSARALPQLLSMWHYRIGQDMTACDTTLSPESGMATATASEHTMDSPAHIWEDPTLIRAVSGQIETSLAADQIVDVIDEVFDSVGAFSNSATPDQSRIHDQSAKSIVLYAIIGGIHNSDLIKRVSRKLKSIVKNGLAQLDVEPGLGREQAWVWRLLNVTYSSLMTIVAVHSTEDTLYIDVNAPLAPVELLQVLVAVTARIRRGKAAQSPIELHEAIEAIACCGSVLAATQGRHLTLEDPYEIKTIIALLSQWLSEGFDHEAFEKDSRIEEMLLPTLAQHTDAWLSACKTAGGGTMTVRLLEFMRQKEPSPVMPEEESEHPLVAPTEKPEMQESRIDAYLKESKSSNINHQRFEVDATLDLLSDVNILNGCTDLSSSHSSELRTYLVQGLSSSSQDVQKAAVTRVLGSLQDPARSRSALWLLYLWVTSIPGLAQDYDISPLIVKLSHHMATESVSHRFELAAGTILASLNLKNARSDQHAFETLLASLASILSPAGPPLPPSSARQTYTHITKITHRLLTSSSLRSHLRGRFHILIPLLQSLLRALFVPTQRHAAGSSLPQPPWLDNRGAKRLKARHAGGLSRILQLLTDPTPSSITTYLRSSKGGRAALTDATVAARTHTAHFAPLLIAELAQYMLKGRFCADGVREALMPGIWGLISVVVAKGERDGVGTAVLGMGLPPGAREVVKGLVAEWRRVGGGRGRGRM